MKSPLPISFRTVFSLSALLLLSGCARMGVWQKSATIVGTAGTAGTLIMINNYASVGSSLASGVGTAVLGGAATMIIDSMDATPSQVDAAEAAGRRYLAALDAAKAAENRQRDRHLIAVVVSPQAKSRGQGSVMIYDTQKRRVHSQKVYDVRVLPKVGEIFKFEMGEVEYVGVIPMIGSKPEAGVASPVSTPLAGEAKP